MKHNPYQYARALTLVSAIMTIQATEASAAEGLSPKNETAGRGVASTRSLPEAWVIDSPQLQITGEIVRQTPFDLVITNANTLPSGYVYQVNWGDGTSGSTGTQSTFDHAYSTAGVYQIIVNILASNNSVAATSLPQTATVYNVLCESPIVNRGNATVIHNAWSGAYILGSDVCSQATTTFDCLKSGTGQATTTIDKLVSASGVAHADRLVLPEAAYQVVASGSGYDAIGYNPFLSGAMRQRPVATYAYKATLATADANLNGTFTSVPFDGRVGGWRQSGWLSSSEATRFTPDGVSVEEKNDLGLFSTAQFGYAGHVVPLLVAKNARYGSVRFCSFENAAGASPTFDDGTPFLSTSGITVDQDYAHSGLYSLRITNSAIVDMPAVEYTPDADRAEMTCRFWMRVANSATLTTALPAASYQPIYCRILNQSAQAKVVAQNGEWTLLEASILKGTAVSLSATSVLLTYGSGAPHTVWIDDIRIQPADAQMTAYVYDRKTLKLLAQFDDQHFGLYYKYNEEGKLTHKMIETERGIKTLQETQYNTPKVSFSH